MDKPISSILNGVDSLSSDRLNKTPEKKSLGQDEFLELMMTQLRNQDPLNPAESGEFLSQIAQFGTVNGITELQQSFSSLASSLQSNQALQASTMVGRSVLVEHNAVHLNASDDVNVAVDIPQSAAELQVNILDQAGALVQQFNLGAQGQGLVDIKWNGLNTLGERAAEGGYLVEASAVYGGENQAIPTLVEAPVESVSLSRDGGEPTLNLSNIGSIALNAIKRVL
jgi:flagellar basal-body rod modification protein FlgD